MHTASPAAVTRTPAATLSVPATGRWALAALRLALLTAVLAGASSQAWAQCIRVSGAVPAPVKIQHVDPVYPPAAIAARVQGVVILEISIGADGAVSSAAILRSIPLLDAAAIAAVNQWRYAPRPGGPCLIMTVTVTFTLPADTSAPSNLQASVAGNILSLSWQPPTLPVTSYVIEAGTATGLSDIAIVPVSASPPSLSVAVPNGTYFIRVRAIGAGGTSAPSNEVTAVVGCTQAPAAPLAFAVTQGPGGNPVHFSWAPPLVAVDAYRLEAGSATGLTNVATLPLAGAATSFSVQAPPGTYFVRVRAQNGCGLSAPSAEVVVTVGTACAPPSAPQNLAASVSGQVVTLGWTPPATGTPPVTYTVLAGSAPGASNLATVPMGTMTSLQASVPHCTYYVRVGATNACGASGPSNEATVVVGGGTTAPLLTFTITPNPVPFAGVFAGCAGSQIAQKTWIYTLRITNQGSGPFVISSFSGRVTTPLLPAPFEVQYGPIAFAQAFGASTIVPQGSLQGPLCVAGHYDEASLVWTFVDVSGATFVTPAIQFLRSPF